MEKLALSEPIPRCEFIEMVFSPRTLHILEPLVRQAAAEEWESEQSQIELLNFANELRARLQRITRGL